MDAPDGVDLDRDVNMERDGKDEEDEEQEVEKEEEVVDEDEEEDEKEDEDEDNGKKPLTIGQGEMVSTSADNAVTMVDDQLTVLLEQGQEMSDHTPQPQRPAPTLRPQTIEPPPWPRIPETHTVCGLEFWRLVTPQKPRPVLPILREVEVAGNASDVDVEQ